MTDRDPAGVLPPTIPGYTILQSLGRGAMGEVYLARQQSLGRLVAIKLLGGRFTFEDVEDRPARFRREAELMAQVNHPNVLSVFDFGWVGGRPYLVMEYVEGGDLRRLLEPGRPLSTQRSRAILRAVGEALICLHRHQILHRDLKPENILLHEEGHPKVADFGIAVLRTGTGALTGDGVGLGTAGYVAPEQRYRLKVDERADQYSLAALAYEMLTGQLPLGVVRPPSEQRPGLATAVDEVLLRGLREDPDDRYPTIRDFLDDLDGALAGAVDRRRFAVRLPMIGGLLLIGAVVVAAVVLFPRLPALPPRAVGPPIVPDPPAVAADPPATAEEPESPWSDPLVPFLEGQIERHAHRNFVGRTASGEDGDERTDWTAAVHALLDQGPMAEGILRRIDEEAYLRYEARGGGDGGSLDDWVAARDEFLERDRLREVIDETIAARALVVFEENGRVEGNDLENWYEARRRVLDEGLILPLHYVNVEGISLRLVPAGTFAMEPASGPAAHGETDGPGPVTVRIEHPFYLAEYEMTVGRFGRFIADAGYRTDAEVRGVSYGYDPEADCWGEGPFRWNEPGYAVELTDDFPASQLSYNDARAYCAWLADREGLPYRLPTEAEWAYAATGARGADQPAEEVAWCLAWEEARAEPVGRKPANPIGLHDLLGNVYEWCDDACNTPITPPADGAPARHLRGGGWMSLPEEMWPSHRICVAADFCYPTTGFRLCMSVPEHFY